MSKRIIISESQYSRVFLNEQQLPKANAGEIQQFLKDKGVYKNKVGSTFGNGSAKAFAQYYYGINTDIDTVNKLWKKLKSEGRDVGNTSGFGPKMAKVVSGMINFKENPSSMLTNLYNGLVDNIKPYINKGLEYVSKGSKWLGDKVSQDLYTKHIKTKEDGNKFREWVYEDKKRVDAINNELKKLGFKDGFSKSGAYGNEYFKVAWGLAGVKYIGTTVMGYISDDDWYDKIFDEEIGKASDELKDSISEYKSTYRNENSYKNYIKSLSNWSAVQEDFRWGDEKNININSSNIGKLNEVLSSTCINPSWVLMKKYIAEKKLRMVLGVTDEKNSSNWEKGSIAGGTGMRPMDIRSMGNYNPKPVDILTIIDSYTDMGSHVSWESVGKELAEIRNEKFLGSTDDETIPKSHLKGKGELNTQLSLKSTTDWDSLELKNEKYQLTNEKRARSLVYKLFGEEEQELLLIRNIYSKVLSFIDSHNTMIIGQNVVELARVGKRHAIVNKNRDGYEMSEQIVNIEHLAGEKIEVYYNMRDACTGEGGVFLYFDTTMGIANAKDKYVCCVNNVEGKSITVSAGAGPLAALELTGKRYGATVNFDLECKNENVQSWGDWLSDKGAECANDWHCLADVASIISSFFGPAGILVAAGIDLLSGLGYLIENDEGAVMNGTLTLLGVIPGLGEVSKLFKGGNKVVRTLNKIAVGIEGLDNIEAALAIQRITKNLDKATIEQIQNILDGFGLLKGKEGQILSDFADINKEISNLSSWEKDLLSDFSKINNTEEFVLQYQKHGNLKNMLSSGKLADVVKISSAFQVSLFGGMYLGGEAIGAKLVDTYKRTGWDPFGLFDESGNEKEPDPGSEPIDWELIMNDGDLNQAIKSSGINIDLSKFGEVGNYYKNQIEESTKVILEYQDKIGVLQKSFNDTDEIFKLLGEIKNYPYTNLEASGISDKVFEIHKEILTFVEGLNISKDKTELIKELETFIKKINSVNIDKKTPEQVQLLFIDGEERTEEKSKELLNSVRELMNNEIPKDENMELNEEINRIKALFTNERLYGNLVNEACEDVDDAIKFLNDKGYMVKTTTEHDLCVGPSTPLGKVYESLKTGYSGFKNFKVNVKNYGDQCGLTLKSNTSNGRFYIITLFSDMGKINSGRFNMFYEMDIDPSMDTCQSLMKMSAKIIPSGDVGIDTDSSPTEINMGLKYVKVDGFWDYDGITKKVILKDAGVTMLLNKNERGIKNKFGFVDLSNLLNNTTGGSYEMFSRGGGPCLTTGAFVKGELDWDLTIQKDLTTILNKIK